eukprot:TRINITY_DN3252_c0_g1_i4.p1 TRINITY_DN3252_c0_g1~~TRINITY_DN3252_c0_g1_i4.p1  ORF type:complete len:308 (-),score=43.70 TRINITY_DN3252_c0_g1_i4:3308-4231(-)
MQRLRRLVQAAAKSLPQAKLKPQAGTILDAPPVQCLSSTCPMAYEPIHSSRVLHRSVPSMVQTYSTASREAAWRDKGSATSKSPAGASEEATNDEMASADTGYRLDNRDGGGVDPFSLVADELAMLGDRMRNMVATEVPKLATAAEYFFKTGAQGKRFRPAVLLLMASSMSGRSDTFAIPGEEELSEATSSASSLPSSSRTSSADDCASSRFPASSDSAWGEDPAAHLRGASSGADVAHERGPAHSPAERRRRQQRIAEITEMIHVASLLHDDVLDHADTRRGVGSVNFIMGNKVRRRKGITGGMLQ